MKICWQDGEEQERLHLTLIDLFVAKDQCALTATSASTANATTRRGQYIARYRYLVTVVGETYPRCSCSVSLTVATTTSHRGLLDVSHR